MSNKPLIGINGDFRAARKDAIALSWFNTGYYDSVSATRLKTGPKETDFVNPIPVLLPPMAEDADLRQMLQMLDGVVLTGCAQDLDPVRMGMEKHPHTRPMPSRREDFDRRLCKMAVEMRMPILAIGGGMQLLNVICGGTIYQHVMEECPKALHHHDNVETNLRHILNIVPNTRRAAPSVPVRTSSSRASGTRLAESIASEGRRTDSAGGSLPLRATPRSNRSTSVSRSVPALL